MFNYLSALQKGEDFEKMTKEIDELFGVLMDNYEMFAFDADRKNNIKIGESDKSKRVCRYCNKKSPEVSFKKVAHSISEALGNKKIITNDECDACNEKFGEGIENDLILYLNLYRVFFRIRGKNGIPKLKGKNFEIEIEKYFGLDGHIIITNPNAPTSIALKLNEIEKIVKNNPTQLIVIDEAYVDFGAESSVKLVNKYDNVLVVQTFSKSRSFAGMRLGYAIGSENIIEGLNRLKFSFNSYTVDRISIEAGIESFKDDDYFVKTNAKIIETREKTVKKLKELGFKVLNSSANFIFISHNKVFAGDLYKNLKDNGVLVRYFAKDRIDNYLRVTIGTDEDMEIFIEKLNKLL